ncbi:AMIN-like domain-containing (lipo)protein [Actinophytocola xanthii]|uniref:AMIN-like domain-containing (lipo)protein n=1 Tax=Actinophytocola xanthii TaxID=1912961 RepID=UPI001E4F255E|nr:hypothetical protein [Actinophytocola xanthii]
MATLMFLVGLTPAPAAASVESCAVTWGSGVKSAHPTVTGYMVGLRAGRQLCFDRLVFDFRGAVGRYWVSYVNAVSAEATGEVVPVRGGARLQVSVHAFGLNENYEPTYVFDDPAELVDVTGFRTFRQVAWAGTHHGTTSVGLGVRARLPFRVFTLPTGSSSMSHIIGRPPSLRDLPGGGGG